MYINSCIYFSRLWSSTVGYQLQDLARRHIYRRIIQSNDVRSRFFLPTRITSWRPWKGIAWSGLGFTWAKCEGLVMEDINQDDTVPLKPLEVMKGRNVNIRNVFEVWILRKTHEVCFINFAFVYTFLL